MTSDELALFSARLTSALTDADRKEEAAEIKRGYRVNVWRLCHYLKAADGVVEAVKAGATREAAFRKGFTPTREMHGVSKKLGLALTVEKGRWVDAPAPAKV